MKDMIKRIRAEREGFTLAELLIVVAIIAVLVAIAIPVFSAQLEKSREATDAANLRAAYAEVMTAGLTEDKNNYTKTVDATQTQAGWKNTSIENIGGMAVGDKTDGSQINAVTKGSSWTVAYDATNAKVTITATKTEDKTQDQTGDNTQDQ